MSDNDFRRRAEAAMLRVTRGRAEEIDARIMAEARRDMWQRLAARLAEALFREHGFYASEGRCPCGRGLGNPADCPDAEALKAFAAATKGAGSGKEGG